MSAYRFRLDWLIILLATLSCGKEKYPAPVFETALIDKEISINDVVFIDDSTGFLCGGKRGVVGKIYSTKDGGRSWNLMWEVPGKSLYGISFPSLDLAYACGEELLVIRSSDTGRTWKEYEYPYPADPLHNVTLRTITHSGPGLVVIAGGQNFSPGVMVRFINGGFTWIYQHWERELRDVHLFGSETGMFFAYGAIYQTTDSGKTWSSNRIKDDFFTGFAPTGFGEGVACGYDGGIYRLRDLGASYDVLQKPNRQFAERIHLNDTYISPGGKGLIIGNNGVAFITSDYGHSWRRAKDFSDKNLLRITPHPSGALIIPCDDGSLIRLTL